MTVPSLVSEPYRHMATNPRSRLTGFLVGCTIGAFSTILPAQEPWPQFRGAGASGIGDGLNAPTAWNVETGENVLWKIPIPGLAHSSPIVWGDRVFVTTTVSSADEVVLRYKAGRAWGISGDVEEVPAEPVHSWRLVALGRLTGDILWERVVREGQPAEKRHPKGTHANATPVTDGRHVVAWFGAEGLFAYDMEGNLLWQRDLGVVNAAFDRSGDQWGIASSPIVYRDSVILQVDGLGQSFVAAFDIATGEERWRTARDEITTWATPTVYRGATGDELITNGTRRIRGYDPATGRELWSLPGGSSVVVPTPQVAGDLIVVTNGHFIPGIRPIYAIRPGSRGDLTLTDGAVRSEQVAWSDTRGGVYIPTQIIYQGILYSLDDNGALIAYELETGEQIYRVRAERGSVYSASPVAADGLLYLTSEEGDVHVIEAGREYRKVRTNPLGELSHATPAISGGMMFFRTRHHLLAVGSGERR
ncbi:MAG TPA: PQQ-binding-like beta-propeller repeat protein [Vicinamibacterales bacterium]|nr:PQQ-binding-like beta-propeller repeat protein [Vicinamibacterales bacterium]